MRIAHVTDGYLPRLGGIETQVHDLAHAQLAAGHDVEVITTTRDTLTPARGPGPDSAVVHRPSPDRSRTGAVITALADRALTGRYDIVHVHLSIASPLAMSVLWRAAGAGRPVVATMHSMWGPAEPALGGFRRLLGDRARSVTWTAVSSAAAAPLRRGLGVPVTVVPNGVDVGWWAENRLRPDSSKLRVLSVMRLSRRKRPVPLVRMMSAADRSARDQPFRPGLPAARLSLTVVGDGRQLTRLRHEARLADSIDVTLAGRCHRVGIRRLMSEHDIYVAPAPLESFGLAALEARSAGLPVVAYRCSGVADFIRDGWDGVLVNDDGALMSAITDLVRHPEVLEQLQTHARDCRPQLGWSVTLSGYESVYGHATVAPRVGSRRSAVHA